MKQFVVRCDVEGVTGVVSFEQAEPGTEEYEFAKRMLLHDLKALERGLYDGGAEEIILYDMHFNGRNVDPLLLSKRTKLISGKPPYREDWSGGVTEDTAGLILLGFHSMDGTAEGGLLSHTYEHDIKGIRVNGTQVGEIGMEAAVAGDRGVPLLLITGDKAGAVEAEALVKGVSTAVVKDGVTEFGGLCYSGEETEERIYKAALSAARGEVVTEPLRFESPVELKVTLYPGIFFEQFIKIFPECRSGEYEITLQGKNASGAYGDYWNKKRGVKASMER